MSGWFASTLLGLSPSVAVAYGAQAGAMCALTGIGCAILHLANVIEKKGTP